MTPVCRIKKSLSPIISEKGFCVIFYLTVAAVFLYEAATVCTLLIGGVRLMGAYNNFIKHTVALLVVVIFAGKY